MSDVITIEVTSYCVPNLTLIDLPGIVGAKIEDEPGILYIYFFFFL